MLSLVLQIIDQVFYRGSANTYEDNIKTIMQEMKKEGLRHMLKLVCNLLVLNNG